ncbi:AEC family transporter [Desulfovibrio sp. SGI.169]|uniref:AEC family transporter n=1 Tax=Desulfovibrio sp. SGI.169 TaxID=3420561 RepID=UPI003D0592C3
MDRLLLTLGIIFASLTAGYAFRHAVTTGRVRLSGEALALARRCLQTTAVFALIPVSAMLSLWGLPSPDTRLLALPLLGLTAWVWGGALSLLFARLLRLNRAQTGSLYCCGTFTNIGAVGSLVCVLFLGESAIALVALYRLCEELFYFSVSFPIARWYSQEHGGRLSFRNLRFDPILKVVLSALLLGIALNLLHVPRPEFCGPLASGFMILATVLFLFAIGLSLKLASLRRYTRQSLAVCIIKFIGVPLLITGLARCIGYGNVDNGLPLKVVAVLSAMPVAMTALVPPSLFRLDLDLANACWIFSTLALAAVLPALLAILPRL